MSRKSSVYVAGLLRRQSVTEQQNRTMQISTAFSMTDGGRPDPDGTVISNIKQPCVTCFISDNSTLNVVCGLVTVDHCTGSPYLTALWSCTQSAWLHVACVRRHRQSPSSTSCWVALLSAVPAMVCCASSWRAAPRELRSSSQVCDGCCDYTGMLLFL